MPDPRQFGGGPAAACWLRGSARLGTQGR